MPGASCAGPAPERRVLPVLLARSVRPARDAWSLRGVSLLCGQTFPIIISHKFELNMYQPFKMEFRPSV